MSCDNRIHSDKGGVRLDSYHHSRDFEGWEPAKTQNFAAMQPMSSCKNRNNTSNVSDLHTLSLNDLDKIEPYLVNYYEKETAEAAIKALKKWYIDQQFDNDDFMNDWIPNDFENCDGIDIFMNKLSSSPQINNIQNKHVIFQWFCYWLYPNINKPTTAPTKPLRQTTFGPCNTEIKQIALQLTELLRLRLKGKISDIEAQKIGQFFVSLCHEQQVM